MLLKVVNSFMENINKILENKNLNLTIFLGDGPLTQPSHSGPSNLLKHPIDGRLKGWSSSHVLYRVYYTPVIQNIVNSCSVYGCTSNYNKKDMTNYILIFTFPGDSQKRAAWIRKIQNKDLKVTKNSRVCINHFEEKNIKRFDIFKCAKWGSRY